MKSIRLHIVAALLTVALPALAHAAEFEWKFFSFNTPGSKPVLLHRAFADDVEKASGGRLKITIYTADELPYKGPDSLRVIANNQVQIGDVSLQFTAGDVPELNVMSMPFACSKATSFDNFYDKVAPSIQKTVEGVLADRFKSVALVQWIHPQTHIWLRRPIKDLEGIKGLKIRTFSREQAEIISAVGGSGVSITAAEVIPALQRGIVDGAFTSHTTALDLKFHQVVKFGYLANIHLAHNVLTANKESVDKLPADLRAILLDRAQAAQARYRTVMKEYDVESKETLQKNGIAFLDASEADLMTLRSAAKPIWEQWTARNGKIAADTLSAVVAGCE